MVALVKAEDMGDRDKHEGLQGLWGTSGSSWECLCWTLGVAVGTRQGCLGSLLWCQNLLGKTQAAGEWSWGKREQGRAGAAGLAQLCQAAPQGNGWVSVGKATSSSILSPVSAPSWAAQASSGRKCCPEEESKARQGRGRGYGWRSTGISRTLEQALPARGEGRALTDSLLPAPHHLLPPQLGKIKGAEPDSSCPAWPPGEELKAVSFRG